MNTQCQKCFGPMPEGYSGTCYECQDDPQAGMSLADRVRSINHAFNRGDNRKADVIALGDKIGELEELLSTLVYWHDQGHIDESWWDEARNLVRHAP